MRYKHIICGALLFTSAASFAQSTDKAQSGTANSFKSINGHEVLPQEGDWALGISATGFFNYFGNMFSNDNSNSAPSFNTANTPDAFATGKLSGMAIMGKYMKSNDMAYRFRFQANAGSVTHRNNVLESSLTPDPMNPKFVEDDMTESSYVVMLGAGIEKRRGHNRIQGFYGAEVLLGCGGDSKSFSYGNSYNNNFNTPLSTVDFSSGSTANLSARTKTSNAGMMFMAGVRGFTGVEYFIAPKLSLGGEIGYTLGFSTHGKGFVETEGWNVATMQTTTVSTTQFNNAGLRSFGIGLDNLNAGINLHFYF